MQKIIDLRKNHETEFTAFQNYVAEFTAEANKLVEVTARDALVEHLELHFRKTLLPSLNDIRKVFSLADVDTTSSVLNVNFVIPAAVGGVASGFGLGVDPLIGSRRLLARCDPDDPETSRSGASCVADARCVVAPRRGGLEA